MCGGGGGGGLCPVGSVCFYTYLKFLCHPVMVKQRT